MLILILAGMYLGLVLDIRVEHVDAVHNHRIAWVPILFSAVTALFCLVAVVIWNRTCRRIALLLFLSSGVVGVLGVFQHTHGKLRRLVNTSVKAWTDPDMGLPDGPPLDAPLAFVGLGAIGSLASLDRFNEEES